jgi:RHS repeat-associated protein
VGNRLSETTNSGTTTYTLRLRKGQAYDIANRLTDVNGATYSWDNNGNLLNDGVNTYSYNHANRLISVVGPSTSSSYAYNGLGDRLQQTVDSVTERYTLDINSGLTQVGLGSVRQLAESDGVVSMSKVYQPFGEVMNNIGPGTTSYGFTGEWTDSTDLVYLRSRYYQPDMGRFISKDIWPGNPSQPGSLNKWVYVENDPVNGVDPLGLRRYEIWAAAFIKKPFISFPYIYYPKFWDPTFWVIASGPLPPPGFPAIVSFWKGDNRNFYAGEGSLPSSRVWQKAIIDTNLLDPAVFRGFDTERTYVAFTFVNPPLLVTGTASAKAPAPPPPKVYRDKIDLCLIRVEFDIYSAPASGANPLSPPSITPSIRYQYSLEFDLRTGILTFEGKHSAYPWHELFVGGIDKSGFSEGLENRNPSGPTGTPIDLYSSVQDVLISPKSRQLPEDEMDKILCSACKPEREH